MDEMTIIGRHPVNKNLLVVQGHCHRGVLVQFDKGPFILQYLNSLYDHTDSVLAKHRCTFAFRVDLRLPLDQELDADAFTHTVFSRFIGSFRAKIAHNRAMARKSNGSAHSSDVHFIWCREIGEGGRPHYHVIIMLNKDAFSALGMYEYGRNNIFNRVNEAWASALRLPVETLVGRAHIPDNPVYHIRRNNPTERADFLYRASYMCKVATKAFGAGHHPFGTSQARVPSESASSVA